MDKQPTPKPRAASARKDASGGTAATSVRGRLPTLAAAQAQALRGFFAAPQRWLLADGSELRFAPGRAGTALETFHADADGGRLALRLDASAAIAKGDGLHWSDYVGRSRLLAWSLAHEPALVRLSEALGVTLTPVESDADTAPGDAVWLSFAIDDDATDGDPLPAVRGAIGFPPDWLSRLVARAEPTYEDDPLPPIDAWRGLPVSLAIAVDGPQLDAGAWRSLRAGDVLLLGRVSTLRCSARGARRTWPLAPTPKGWRIDGDSRPTPVLPTPSPQERDAMTDTDAPASDSAPHLDAADAAAREIPVQVAFDIGQIELSVGEMSSLQPGYVFALPTHLEGANVTLRANGRVAGRGEVVAVGDTLGVRLLSWAS